MLLHVTVSLILHTCTNDVPAVFPAQEVVKLKALLDLLVASPVILEELCLVCVIVGHAEDLGTDLKLVWRGRQ